MAFIRETSTSGIDDSVSGALSVTGLITATAGIKLGNNKIYASDGGETITLDTSDNVTILGNLTVTGNNIISSSATAITLSGADATVVGDLTVTGGDAIIKKASGAATLLMQCDNSAGNGDDWTVTANADHSLTIGNDLSGSHVAHLTITPHATVAQSSVTVAGDLIVSGNDLTFGNGESINNTANGELRMISDQVIVYGVGASQATIFKLWSKAGEDTQLRFTEQGDSGEVEKWTVGHDASASDELCFMHNATAIAESTAKMKLESDGDLIIAGDLTVTGNRVTFGNEEYIHNETDNRLTLKASTTYIDGTAEIHSGAETNASLVLNAPDTYDPVVIFQEATTAKWYIGVDGTDDEFYIGTGSTVGSNAVLYTDQNSDGVDSVVCARPFQASNLKTMTSLTVEIDANNNEDQQYFAIADGAGNVEFKVNEAGQVTAKGFSVSKTTVTTKNTAGNVTYTVDEFIEGFILRDCAGSGRSDVTPTAAQIVADIDSAAVGTAFRVLIKNTSDAAETITMTAGTGVTLSGTMTIAQNTSREFLCVLTNVSGSSEAATFYNLGEWTHG